MGSQLSSPVIPSLGSSPGQLVAPCCGPEDWKEHSSWPQHWLLALVGPGQTQPQPKWGGFFQSPPPHPAPLPASTSVPCQVLLLQAFVPRGVSTQEWNVPIP